LRNSAPPTLAAGRSGRRTERSTTRPRCTPPPACGPRYHDGDPTTRPRVNWPYIHIVINHFPIILTIVGSAVLALALVVRRRGLWLYAVATLTLAGASVYPVYFAGDKAADAVRTTWYIIRSSVEEHDASANYALVAGLLMGVVS